MTMNNTIALAVAFVFGLTTIPGRCDEAESRASVKALLDEGIKLNALGPALTVEEKKIETDEKSYTGKDATIKTEARKIQTDTLTHVEKGRTLHNEIVAHEATRSGVDRTNKGAVAGFNTKLDQLKGRAKASGDDTAKLLAREKANNGARDKLSQDTLTLTDRKKANADKKAEMEARLGEWRQRMNALLNSDFLKDLKMREKLSQQAAAAANAKDLEAAVKTLKKVWDGAR